LGTPWERADVERELLENTWATGTPREHLGSLRKNGITGTPWEREHLGNAVGMPWAWERLERLGHVQTFGTPWERHHGNAWRRPWEHLGNALGMGTHWEHLGNGLTLNGYTVGRYGQTRERLERLGHGQTFGTPWERDHGNAWRRPWEHRELVFRV